MSLSYRNQSTDLLCKSIDRFLYGRALVVTGLMPQIQIYVPSGMNSLKNIENIILRVDILQLFLRYKHTVPLTVGNHQFRFLSG